MEGAMCRAQGSATWRGSDLATWGRRKGKADKAKEGGQAAGRRIAFTHCRWPELAVAGTCVDLLTDEQFFAGGNEVKEGRSELENFFGVKIVNAGSCNGKVDNCGSIGEMTNVKGLMTKE
jgi:hypothetical protein